MFGRRQEEEVPFEMPQGEATSLIIAGDVSGLGYRETKVTSLRDCVITVAALSVAFNTTVTGICKNKEAVVGTLICDGEGIDYGAHEEVIKDHTTWVPV